MTIAALKGVSHFPRLPQDTGGVPGVGTVATLDASGEGVAFMCQAPKTGNIRKIFFRIGNSAGAGTLTVRLKEIDRAGTPAIPHATNLSHVNATGTYDTTGTDDNTVQSVTLTADAAVVESDYLCVEVLITTIGTITALVISGLTDERGGTNTGYPYAVTNTAGSYALISNNQMPSIAFEYDDGSYEPIIASCLPGTITSTTFASGSTPDTIGQRFQFPGPVRFKGIWLWADTDDDFTIRLVSTAYHQGNGTGILSSRTYFNEDRGADAGNIHEIRMPSYDLSASTNYRIIIEPGATGITIYDQSFGSLAQMDAEDMGQNFHLTTAKDPTGDGSWTNYNSGTFRQLYCGLLLGGFDAGGGGGLLRAASYSGGMAG